ncbi:MAG: AI-2E family transporter [Armatimonadota bacterium]|nr:MAG: AI-2E family transporter [Armatimonadota bacterium]
MEIAPQPRRITPAAAVVILVFALLLIIATVWLLWLPIQLFIIAALVALAMSHPVNWLAKRRVPRIVAVIGVLVLIVAAVTVLLGIFVPPLTRQTADLIDNIPSYWNDLRPRLEEVTQRYPWIQERIAEVDVSGEVTKRARDWLASGWSLAVDVASGLVVAILLLITIVFMLVNPQPLIKGIIGLVPEPWSGRALEIGAMLTDRIRAWLRGLVILGSIIGVAVGAGLSILGVPYAVLFGVLAGVLEAVPTIGPVLSAVPPILVALALDPLKGLGVLVLFIVVQQLENTFLVPYIMSRQLQLHPVSIIFGFIALGTLFHLFGAIVAVPTVACLKVLYDEVYYPWAHPAASAQAACAEEAAAEREAGEDEPPQ